MKGERRLTVGDIREIFKDLDDKTPVGWLFYWNDPENEKNCSYKSTSQIIILDHPFVKGC